MNTKSELKFINDKITLEKLDKTLNEIASSINNGINLFDNNNFKVNFENINEIEKTVDLEEIHNQELEIIDLSTSLLNNNNKENEKEDEVSITDNEL